MAVVARIRDDPLEFSLNRLLDLGDHCCKGVPAVAVARQRLHMSHELSALGLRSVGELGSVLRGNLHPT